MNGLITILLCFISIFSVNASGQMNISYNKYPPPNCLDTLRIKVFPRAQSANAVCRPEVYKTRTRRVRYALQRINRWKNYAQKKWDQEHNDIYDNTNGKMNAPLYPSYSYDQAIVYMYEEWADECGRFNSKLADSLIELSHLNNSCKDTLAFESLQRMWRDNTQVQSIYRNYGRTDTLIKNRDIASQEYDHRR